MKVTFVCLSRQKVRASNQRLLPRREPGTRFREINCLVDFLCVRNFSEFEYLSNVLFYKLF